MFRFNDLEWRVFISYLLCTMIILTLVNIPYSESESLDLDDGEKYTLTPNSLEGFQPGLASEYVTYANSHSSLACYLTSLGKVYCWGGVNYLTGGVISSTTIPTLATALNNTTVVSMALYSQGGCFMFSNLTVGCIGEQAYNGGSSVLGNSVLSTNYHDVLVYPFGDTHVKSITSASRQQGDIVCIITIAENMVCSGTYLHGEMGDGRYYAGNSWWQSQEANISIPIPSSYGIHQISIGNKEACAIDDLGDLYCWGGEVSFNCPPVSNCAYPTKVNIFPDSVKFSAISVGDGNVCALLQNNSVYCWGYFGDSNYPFYVNSDSNPQQVLLGGSQVINIDHGGTSYASYYCATLFNGTVVCWGHPNYGSGSNGVYLKNGGGTWDYIDNVYFNYPSSNEKYVAVQAGWRTTCALTNNSEFDCWGTGAEQGGMADSSSGYGGCCWGSILVYNNQVIPGTNRDVDNDGISNMNDYCENGYMNWIPSSTYDYDQDGCHDTLEDNDDDNDGYLDTLEQSCQSSQIDENSIPPDFDLDGICDNLDLDDDGDGSPDASDSFPHDAYEWEDTDGDGTGNNADTDDDNDGWADTSDDFPLDSTEWNDLDGDGIGDNSDADDDGDGWSDTAEQQCGTNQNSSASYPPDNDGDYICDSQDSDDDNDGIPDDQDDFPMDSSEWTDTDGDGIGDNSDLDDDNDGYPILQMISP